MDTPRDVKTRILSDFYVQVVGKWQLETPKRKLDENTEIIPRK
jgi:hypothetical protein